MFSSGLTLPEPYRSKSISRAPSEEYMVNFFDPPVASGDDACPFHCRVCDLGAFLSEKAAPGSDRGFIDLPNACPKPCAGDDLLPSTPYSTAVWPEAPEASARNNRETQAVYPMEQAAFILLILYPHSPTGQRGNSYRYRPATAFHGFRRPVYISSYEIIQKATVAGRSREWTPVIVQEKE